MGSHHGPLVQRVQNAPVPETTWIVRPARPEDAEGWVACHLQALSETYPQMPAEFVGSRRRQQRELVAETAEQLSQVDGVAERCWVGVEPDGTVVGVGHSGPGPQEWERRLLQGYPDRSLGLHRGVDDPTLRNLHKLYTVARSHGTGLGRALAGPLVGDEACYLWIMTGNPRADAFYRRLGFARASVAVPSGPSWYGWPMFQMYRAPQRPRQ